MGLTQLDNTRKVTIELPESVYRMLAQIASATRQPLEALAAQSVTGNLPPSVESAPEVSKADLLAMQGLSIEELLQIAGERVSVNDQARQLDLLERNSDGLLDAQESEELSALRAAADQLMLRKAYAWALLRWRGHRIPALDELSLP